MHIHISIIIMIIIIIFLNSIIIIIIIYLYIYTHIHTIYLSMPSLYAYCYHPLPLAPFDWQFESSTSVTLHITLSNLLSLQARDSPPNFPIRLNMWREEVSDAVANLWAAKPCDGRKAGTQTTYTNVGHVLLKHILTYIHILSSTKSKEYDMDATVDQHVGAVVPVYLIFVWRGLQSQQVAWTRLGVFLFEQLPKAGQAKNLIVTIQSEPWNRDEMLRVRFL